MAICKRIEYDPLQHREAERDLRQWSRVGMQVLRLGVLAVILAAWFWLANRVSVEEHRRMGWPMAAPTWRDRAATFFPYAIFLPLLVWVWYRAKMARRKRWIERVRAAGIQAVEFSAEGVLYWSDRARYFSRWDTFSRIVDRPHVLLFFVNAATVVLIPKIDVTDLETAQILEWQRAFAATDSLLDRGVEPAAADFTLEIQADRRDVEEAGRASLRNSAKVPLLVARWVRITVSCMIFLGFVAFGFYLMRRGASGLYLYWTMFGVPIFILVIYLWSYAWVLFVRRLNWRELRGFLGQRQLLRMDSTGVDWRSRTCDNHYDWLAIHNVLVGKRTVVLSVLGGGFITIPRRQIPANEGDFVGYLQQRVHRRTSGFPVEMPAAGG